MSDIAGAIIASTSMICTAWVVVVLIKSNRFK